MMSVVLPHLDIPLKNKTKLLLLSQSTTKLPTTVISYGQSTWRRSRIAPLDSHVHTCRLSNAILVIFCSKNIRDIPTVTTTCTQNTNIVTSSRWSSYRPCAHTKPWGWCRAHTISWLHPSLMPVGNERIEVSYILSGHVVTELYLLAFIEGCRNCPKTNLLYQGR